VFLEKRCSSQDLDLPKTINCFTLLIPKLKRGLVFGGPHPPATYEDSLQKRVRDMRSIFVTINEAPCGDERASNGLRYDGGWMAKCDYPWKR
jgi:hypothetical protein